MTTDKKNILTINGGSSSIKFAVYNYDNTLSLILEGQIDGIGTKRTQLSYETFPKHETSSMNVQLDGSENVTTLLMEWLEKQPGFENIGVIAHRVVEGQNRTEPEEISDELLNVFSDISDYDPEHMISEIKLITLFRKRYPQLRHFACFDTSFHASMPHVAQMLSIPRRYNVMGIRRYGFHGLSYTYIMDALHAEIGGQAAKGKIILAHLGNGASMCAVKDGKSLDTSMGFTPTSGMAMGSRTGDLDPGVALYLMQYEHLTPKNFSRIVNHESGLLGISETSSDMRDLIAIESTDKRAAEAIEYFCYQARKWIGSFAAVLEGLDTIVFTGGIGEHAPEIRERICSRLAFLGVEVDIKKNEANAAIISAADSKVTVRVMHTDEQLMIAKLVLPFIKNDKK